MFPQHSFVVCLMLSGLIVVSVATHRRQRVDNKCGEGWKAHGKVKCVKLIKGRLSQEEAQEKCKAEGTRLVKIANNVEQAFINTEILAEIWAANPKAGTIVWTDGKRDQASGGNFKWEDGIVVSENMLPSGRSMGSDCLALATGMSGNETNPSLWSARRCEDKADYSLCEKEYPKATCTPTATPTTLARPTSSPGPVPKSKFFCTSIWWHRVKDNCYLPTNYGFHSCQSAAKVCSETIFAKVDLNSRVRARLPIIRTAEEQKRLGDRLVGIYGADWGLGSFWLGARRVPGMTAF